MASPPPDDDFTPSPPAADSSSCTTSIEALPPFLKRLEPEPCNPLDEIELPLLRAHMSFRCVTFSFVIRIIVKSTMKAKA